MASRLYFPSSGAAAVNPPISGADWSHIAAQRRPLNAVQGSSAIQTLTVTPDAADHLVAGAVFLVQYVSALLPPQVVLAQAVKIQARVSEADAANNLALAWRIWASSEDGQTNLGTLLALKVDGTEAATSLTNRGDSATTSEVALTVNWRMIVELGMSGTPTAAAGTQGHNGAISLGEAGAVDLPEDDAATAAGTPWIQFARPLKIGTGTNLHLEGDECGGGGHVHVHAQANAGTEYAFVYEVDELIQALPEETIRDTVLGILRLHAIGKTGTEVKADLAAGIDTVI